jgi:hypothetical protein
MENMSSWIKPEQKIRSETNLTERQPFVCELTTLREPTLHSRDFDRALMEAVDEGLGWLGKSARETIYHHLERDFNIKRRDIPFKVEKFAEAIEQIFGTASALLEIQIMKTLHEKVGDSHMVFPETQNLVFTEYVEAVKLSFLNKLL